MFQDDGADIVFRIDVNIGGFAFHHNFLLLLFDRERDVELLNLVRRDRDCFRLEYGEALGENLDIIVAGRQIFDFIYAVAIGGDGDQLAASRSDEHRCAGYSTARWIGYLATQRSGGGLRKRWRGENGNH